MPPHTTGSRTPLVAVTGLDIILGVLSIVLSLALAGQEGFLSLLLILVIGFVLQVALDLWMLAGSKIAWFIRSGLAVLAVIGAILSFNILGLIISTIIIILLFKGGNAL